MLFLPWTRDSSKDLMNRKSVALPPSGWVQHLLGS